MPYPSSEGSSPSPPKACPTSLTVHNGREHSALESSRFAFSLASTSTTPSTLSNAFLLLLSFHKEKGCLDRMLHIADVILTGRAHPCSMPVLVRRFDMGTHGRGLVSFRSAPILRKQPLEDFWPLVLPLLGPLQENHHPSFLTGSIYLQLTSSCSPCASQITVCKTTTCWAC